MPPTAGSPATARSAPVKSAVTGEVIAETGSGGLDFGRCSIMRRKVGGPALRAMTFHERAWMLKDLANAVMARKEELYELSYATGATRTDGWIDIEGGAGTLFSFSSKGRRELPNGKVLIDGAMEPLSRGGSFVGQHVYTPLQGVAVHINAFNFPVWGMLEKLGPTLLAGVPAIVKPASATGYLTEACVRIMIEADVLPKGALQLIMGAVGDLLDHLTLQDVVSFTGSAATAMKLQSHPVIARESVRFVAERDSLNASILGPDAGPGTPEFDLFVKEVAREMTVKAGQKCTAIRRAMAPAEHLDAVAGGAVGAARQGPDRRPARRGDPDGRARQPRAARNRCARRSRMLAKVGADRRAAIPDASPVRRRRRLHLADPAALRRPLGLAGGPRCRGVRAGFDASCPIATSTTRSRSPIAAWAALALSLFTFDRTVAEDFVLGAGAYHGRMVILDRTSAKESTGHGSPLPVLVHGGPGRAGGGEEMGGVRGVKHYMQRTALQGSPDRACRRSIGQWLPGAEQLDRRTSTRSASASRSSRSATR